MINKIQINNKDFKIDDIFLITAGKTNNGESGITIYQNRTIPTLVKSSSSQDELYKALENYKETLDENGVYNFALLADRFLVNIENLVDEKLILNYAGYHESFLVEASFKSGPSLALVSTKDEDFAKSVIDDFNYQKQIYELNSQPLVLDETSQSQNELNQSN